jgi:hypothetical protein
VEPTSHFLRGASPLQPNSGSQDCSRGALDRGMESKFDRCMNVADLHNVAGSLDRFRGELHSLDVQLPIACSGRLAMAPVAPVAAMILDSLPGIPG